MERAKRVPKAISILKEDRQTFGTLVEESTAEVQTPLSKAAWIIDGMAAVRSIKSEPILGEFLSSEKEFFRIVMYGGNKDECHVGTRIRMYERQKVKSSLVYVQPVSPNNNQSETDSSDNGAEIVDGRENSEAESTDDSDYDSDADSDGSEDDF
eukprot:gene6092-11477_t